MTSCCEGVCRQLHILSYRTDVRGEGAAVNPVEAARYLRMAAEQDFASAQYNLGLLYLRGQGVDENHSEAAMWMHRAADGGDALSLSRLGTMYEYGRGVEQDAVTAYMWYSLGAVQGQSFAKERRNILAKNLSALEVKRAEALVSDWIRRKAR